jgi:hypothetical protein
VVSNLTRTAFQVKLVRQVTQFQPTCFLSSLLPHQAAKKRSMALICVTSVTSLSGSKGWWRRPERVRGDPIQGIRKPMQAEAWLRNRQTPQMSRTLVRLVADKILVRDLSTRC